MKKRTVLTISFALAAVMLAAGCGYTHKSLLPGDIKTVRIDIFQNETWRQDVELTVTKAIINKINSTTNLKITDTNPDSILKGTLTGTPTDAFVTSHDQGVVTTGEVGITVTLVWTDARTNGEIPLRSKKVTASASYNIERGESRATAMQAAANRLADKVVNAMQEEW